MLAVPASDADGRVPSRMKHSIRVSKVPMLTREDPSGCPNNLQWDADSKCESAPAVPYIMQSWTIKTQVLI